MNLADLNPLAHDLMSYMQKKAGFHYPPSAITYKDDHDNASKILGKTAFYDPNSSSVTIYVTGRHPKDILRSLAHELVHHKQNEKGEFNDLGPVGEGYAQSNKKLRNMEREAYTVGNMCFRDWEDGRKNAIMESIYKQQQILRRNKTMDIHNWKNSELNRLLMEKFGIKSEKEYVLEENQDRIFAPNHYCAHHVVHEGLEAYTVDHNWDAEKQQVTKYDIRFRDGTIKRNVHVSDLEILEAFNEGSHSGNRDEHPPVKDASKDKKEKKDEDEDAKPDYIDLDGDGNKDETMKKAAKDAKKNLQEAGVKRAMELADEHDVSKKVAQSAMIMMDKGKSEKEAIKMAKRKHADDDSGDSKKELQKKAQKWLDDNPKSKLSLSAVEKKIMDNDGKVPKNLKESRRDIIFRRKVRTLLSEALKISKRK